MAVQLPPPFVLLKTPPPYVLPAHSRKVSLEEILIALRGDRYRLDDPEGLLSARAERTADRQAQAVQTREPLPGFESEADAHPETNDLPCKQCDGGVARVLRACTLIQ